MLHLGVGYRSGAAWLVFALLGPAGAAAQSGVVWSDDLAPVDALAVARDVAPGLDWRAETVEAVAPVVPPPRFDDAWEAYRSGDSRACASALEVFDLARLVAGEHRDAAGELLVLRAACSLVDGDEEAALRAMRLHASMELPDAALSGTPPPVQQLAERARVAVSQAERIQVSLRVIPERATVAIDGHPACETRPCLIELTAGPHVLAVRALGFTPSLEIRPFEPGVAIEVSLEEAGEVEVAAQIERALAAGRTADELVIARAATRVYAAELLLVLRRAGDHHLASVFERGEPSVRGIRGLDPRDVARRALEQWRGPLPWHEDAPLWIGVGGAIAAVAVIVGLVLWYVFPQSTLELFPE